MDLSDDEDHREASPVFCCLNVKRKSRMETKQNDSRAGTSASDLQTSGTKPLCPNCVCNKSCEPVEDNSEFVSGAVSSGQRLSTEAGPEAPAVIEVTEEYTVNDILHRVVDRHKTSMKNKYSRLIKGNGMPENITLLNRIYIIEEDSEEVDEDVEDVSPHGTRPWNFLQGTPISCNDVFKPLLSHFFRKDMKYKRTRMTDQNKPKQQEEHSARNVVAKYFDDMKKTCQLKVAKSTKPDEQKILVKTQEDIIRTVLTKGIGGIGKTAIVQKFVLEWAEDRANQDIHFMFVLPFRELNLIKDEQYSLHRLLCTFYPELKHLDPKMYDVCKITFIFDGLDESRIPLDISQSKKLSDVTLMSTLGVLVANLIKGDLLPSAHVWITSRPEATKLIPSEYVCRVTEIQGFSDSQKEEYFMKAISDQDQAQKIISHIKTTRILHVMCQIPAFCWISATAFQKIMKQNNILKVPETQTELYSHSLCIQLSMRNENLEGEGDKTPENLLESKRQMLPKLSELAFKQLIRGNVMFYEEDLGKCCIDLSEASLYSEIFPEIFREELLLYQKKVYSFVHHSFQEFLGAFYVFQCYVGKDMAPLHQLLHIDQSEILTVDQLMKKLVKEVSWNENTLIDLFFPFLFGLSLESNQRLLQDLMTCTVETSKSVEKTIQSIKSELREGFPSADQSINLFICLKEMHDQSLSKEIEGYIKSGYHSEDELSVGYCSLIAFMTLISEEVLDELNPVQFNPFWRGYQRMTPAVLNCRKAVLAGCSITTNCCKILRSALQSADSPLKELDLSNNHLQDSRMKLLADGLKSPQCRLESLRLNICSLTMHSCEILMSVLQSASSRLKSLDISNNDLLDAGVEILSTGLESSHCKLEILRLSGCMVTEQGCSYLASALSLNPSYLKELDLTYNFPGKSGVRLLSARLEDSHCKLETLRMEDAGKFRIKPGLQKYAVKLTLDPKTAAKELSLSKRNTKVTCKENCKSYLDCLDRFGVSKQVLCRESLSGRCYWEIEFKGVAGIAVTHGGISRKGDGDNCSFGYNEKSWCLYYCPGCMFDFYRAVHKSRTIKIHDYTHKVGVYLDCLSGTLSFYNVSCSLAHLYTYHLTFTEPLYAGFNIQYSGSSLCICPIK